MSKPEIKPCTECGSKQFRVRLKDPYTIEITCMKCGHVTQTKEEHSDELC